MHAGNYDSSLFENYPLPKGLQKRIVKFPEDVELHPRKFYLHSASVGCVGLYSDVSKVQNVPFFRQHFDKRVKISAWLNF